jgi:hypothetical protein
MINSLYQRTRDRLLKLPLLTWVLLGFFIPFLAFFIVPIFFDPSQSMQFKQYVLAVSPIGYDFRAIVSFSSTWIHSGVLVPIVYPSFTLLFFAPFTFLSNETGYRVIVLFVLICYILITVFLPRWIDGSKGFSALAMLIFVTGLVSYGLQFEMERGQWNVIAFASCLAAIYIFHHYPKRRWLAYLLFTVSVQLKLYPAIFVFALIEDWTAWKVNLRRMMGLGIVNILALFILGVSPVLNTIHYMVDSEASHVGRPFNLSISSFVLHILSLSSLPHKRIILWLQADTWLPQFLLLVFFAVCFLIILRQVYKKNSGGVDPHLFLACTIGACIIPAISFDYKLPVLAASMMLLIPVFESYERRERKVSVILWIFLFSIAYSSLLYSYVNKPEILQYNLPALLALLIMGTISACVKPGGMPEPAANAPEVEPGDP